MERLTEKQLCALGVYDLRELARRVGVVPGNRKKSEIVASIIAVYEGKEQPVCGHRKGRPVLKKRDWLGREGEDERQRIARVLLSAVMELYGYQNKEELLENIEKIL